ncbi:hypothetical protein J4E81_007184 [Alternaria sp. BMP 2799]|uniref:uncharacterized protein n=1 Tax=Alternaria metachromatica TaxID=283354 RepID=UPI0020C53366|nr:uncharacterized protein J4E83_001975 [Alternaria metachromatica]XP_049213748.1 uncharacterized protein J4E79_003382 [Alternaria viburni]XP_051325608.1 uncharacterized protein J4E85_005879 [Alternaria conjuncta]XP_051349894.1 uncharacterized protein J4E92_008530 [Alternaria infectoria]KAI4691657.1 hypothetical protein J4E81_007184 [Alternaria sp. BMP 2799]KAI4711585.1 hypothetical protein J4E89_004150 [Alternaria sp. Ai002NY15]KAI4634656.1 hypothetical protein J4E83_001975 [Alternaria metac
MATSNQSAQFQEPPTDGLPGATSTTSPSVDSTAPSHDNIDLQFQEPIAPETSTSTSTSTDDNDNSLHKTTTDKLKDAVKKPFGSSDESSDPHTLGKKEITSPEMAAANEVLAAKDLKSP